MKIVQEEAQLLTLRERPVSAWIGASIFGAVGLFILAQPYMFLFGGACFTASFIISHLCSAVTSCVFDKTLDTFTISRQGLFGKEVIQGRLSEIEDIQVEESTDSDGSTYRVSIVLMSGDRLPLTPYYSSDRKNKQETASYIKSFLRGDKSQSLTLKTSSN